MATGAVPIPPLLVDHQHPKPAGVPTIGIDSQPDFFPEELAQLCQMAVLLNPYTSRMVAPLRTERFAVTSSIERRNRRVLGAWLHLGDGPLSAAYSGSWMESEAHAVLEHDSVRDN